MGKVLTVALAAVLLAAPAAMRAQAGDDAAAQNTAKARAVLDAMVQALGGQAWLNMTNEMQQGHIAAFFHGQPDMGTTKYWDFHAWPDRDRVEFTAHRDVVQFYLGREGWGVTYRGKRPIPKKDLDGFLRRRDHSIEMAVKVWMKDPRTILMYQGQHMVERKLGVQVTLISAANESITILTDVQTHLPLMRSFDWRDPVYKDKNTDSEEYADYHVVDGFPTPFSITRLRNKEVVREYFLDHAEYNRALPADFWDVDATTRRIKK